LTEQTKKKKEPNPKLEKKGIVNTILNKTRGVEKNKGANKSARKKNNYTKLSTKKKRNKERKSSIKKKENTSKTSRKEEGRGGNEEKKRCTQKRGATEKPRNIKIPVT